MTKKLLKTLEKYTVFDSNDACAVIVQNVDLQLFSYCIYDFRGV